MYFRNLSLSTQRLLFSFPMTLSNRGIYTQATPKQHLIVALGGNALLRRGQAMTMENQQTNIAQGISSLSIVLKDHTITIVHGNGPQVGMLALEQANYHKTIAKDTPELTLDVLDAETEGMIGYMLEQELYHYIPKERGICTLLSQILVDPHDPAFQNPTKFIGPVYTQEQLDDIGMVKAGNYYKRNDEFFKQDGDYWRRVVPSPRPVKLMDQQMHAVRLMTENDVVVVCGGGGGIPVIQDDMTNRLKGIEAVIDKDRVATMLGKDLNAQGLLILTDVPGVAVAYKTPNEKWIASVSPEILQQMTSQFPEGSMGPKVSSAIDFVVRNGGWSMIGSLQKVDQMMVRESGTLVTNEYGPDHVAYR